MNSPTETTGLLRFVTAGSVDDGKSTLIGRLLYESEGIYEDQLESIQKTSAKKDGKLDLSLITDGLQAEREQAITIDVAYRYFSTTRRKFIIADTPGHEQYTRNMVTAASTADMGVLLVDARKGLLQQTHRHAYLLWLLGVRHLVLAVNKMDLVNCEQPIFVDIERAFAASTSSMRGLTTYPVPIIALAGDNVVRRSQNMTWYSGPSVLELLERVVIEQDRQFGHFRFPVQSVVRSYSNFRGYAGQVVAGSIKPGQCVMALPSGRETQVERIILHKQVLDEASPHQSVLLTLKDHIDLGRGDMLVDPKKMPTVSNHFLAELVWMSERPLNRSLHYLIKHATQVLCCNIFHVLHVLDVRGFTETEADTLQANEIGMVEIETHKPMFLDSYSADRVMGSFIVIDPSNNDTVAAGILSERARLQQPVETVPAFCKTEIEAPGLTVWFTGLSGAGKTTICNAVSTELMVQGCRVEVLDGDVVRKQLNDDLSFSPRDRDENIRRIGFVAQLLARHGVVVLVATISPYRAMREELRQTIPNFVEVYVNAPLAVCEQRDPKGLYKRARKKQISGFTGIDDPYQPPLKPEVECLTDRETVKASTTKVVSAILAFFASRTTKRTPCATSHDDTIVHLIGEELKSNGAGLGGLLSKSDSRD